MKNTSKRNRGFTLIELLVVVAIIAILSAVILSSIYGSRGKARDAKRVSDISQIQLALEQYFDKHQAYPPTLDTLALSTETYISVIPTAPAPGSYSYAVKSDNLDYVLRAVFEKSNDALNDSLSAFPSGSYSSSFSCNKSSYEYCVGPK